MAFRKMRKNINASTYADMNYATVSNVMTILFQYIKFSFFNDAITLISVS